MRLFVRRDCGCRWRKTCIGPRLHLDKAQNILVPADEIDFSTIVRDPEIRGDDSIAQLLQIEERFRFAMFAQNKVIGRA